MAKTRQYNNQTVKEKLSPIIAAQLHVDLEASSWLPWKLLKKKREVYCGPQSQACQNRYKYSAQLKKDKPLAYWKLYSDARGQTEVENKTPVQEEKSDKQESEDEDEEDEDEEDSDESELETSKQPKKTRQKGAPSRESPSKNIYENFQSPSNRKMAPPGSVGSSVSGRGASVRSGTPVKKKNLYASLEEAQEAADEVVEVDFEYPERNGAPTFFLQLTDSVPVDTNGTTKELVSQVKVHLNHLVDVADFDTLTAILVAEGRALLVKLPVLPHFRRNPTHIKTANRLEQFPCEPSNNEYLICVNAIIADENRLYKQYLFVWPDDMVCSTRMESDSPPVADEKIQIKLRKVLLEYTVGKKNVKEVFYPGFWLLRVISDTKKVLEEAEVEADVNDLEDLFGGMHVDDDESFSDAN
jgi:hypothetical protein